MATVLISFIGKGRRSTGQETTRSGYERTIYRFEAEDGIPIADEETSLFGSALHRRLCHLGRTPARWLILGTTESIWQDLADIFSAAAQERLSDLWCEVYAAVENPQVKPLTQNLLDRWAEALTQEMDGTQIICRLVGPMTDAASQQVAVQAVLAAVRDGDEIVQDITHGFRHQPVVMSFAVMLLRWLRAVKKVDLYYGALEMKGRNPVCPVLKLDLCTDLLDATESVAIFRQTGNYARLGSHLRQSGAFARRLEKVLFTEEINKQSAGQADATQVRNELRNARRNFDPLKDALAELLDEGLSWENAASLARVIQRKAQFACDHEQYFKGIALLWEALLLAGIEKFNISGSPTNYYVRKATQKELEEKLEEHLNPGARARLDTIRSLRNAVLHGTEPSASRQVQRKVEIALSSPDAFCEIFDDGKQLLDEILEKLP